MQRLPKLKPGDKVAVISPSFASPAVFPKVFEVGLDRLRRIFELEPVVYPTTSLLNAPTLQRAADITAAFSNPEIKAVISSIGGDDQVVYVKNLPTAVFELQTKPFFGYSDNTHLANFLWLHGKPSFYGGSIMTQFAMQHEMDEYTVNYLRLALFEAGEFELLPSNTFTDEGYDWGDASLLHMKRPHETNEGWIWDGNKNAVGTSWGGCLESIDEMLRHNIPMPSLEQFESIILLLETSEELPSADYVFRVARALGERGILERVQGVLVGRPKAWEFHMKRTAKEKATYRRVQRETLLTTIRQYNAHAPIVQNLDFGHTDPQIPMPYGQSYRINSGTKQIFATF